jgi:hypothetical protein
VVISVLDFNGGVVKDNFIGRLVLGKEASGKNRREREKCLSDNCPRVEPCRLFDRLRSQEIDKMLNF